MNEGLLAQLQAFYDWLQNRLRMQEQWDRIQFPDTMAQHYIPRFSDSDPLTASPGGYLAGSRVHPWANPNLIPNDAQIASRGVWEVPMTWDNTGRVQDGFTMDAMPNPALWNRKKEQVSY